jgi:hypothetical protein
MEVEEDYYYELWTVFPPASILSRELTSFITWELTHLHMERDEHETPSTSRTWRG